MVPVYEQISMGILTCMRAGKGRRQQGPGQTGPGPLQAKAGAAPRPSPPSSLVWAQPSPCPLGHINLRGLFLEKVLRTGKAPQAFPGLEVDVTSLGTGPGALRPPGLCNPCLPGDVCWRESGTPGPRSFLWASGTAGRWSGRKRRGWRSRWLAAGPHKHAPSL